MMSLYSLECFHFTYTPKGGRRCSVFYVPGRTRCPLNLLLLPTKFNVHTFLHVFPSHTSSSSCCCCCCCAVWCLSGVSLFTASLEVCISAFRCSLSNFVHNFGNISASMSVSWYPGHICGIIYASFISSGMWSPWLGEFLSQRFPIPFLGAH